MEKGKTYMARPTDIDRKWYVIDAKDKVLGRLAAEIATILRGKHKPQFTPHMDTGDFVIVVNAEEIKLTGRKREQDLLLAYWLPRWVTLSHCRADARKEAGRSPSESGLGDDAKEQAGPATNEEAQNICGTGASPHGSNASAFRGA